MVANSAALRAEPTVGLKAENSAGRRVVSRAQWMVGPKVANWVVWWVSRMAVSWAEQTAGWKVALKALQRAVLWVAY
jgi:hypothetical protein